jgi:hypothetical protein
MDSLYGSAHLCCAGESEASFNPLSEEDIDRILRHIAHKKFDPKREIEPELFDRTFNILNKAVEKVYGKASDPSHADYDFVQQLRQNNAVFSAFKTHRQQNDIHKQLLNEKGQPRSFPEFKKATEPIIGNYNTNWLKTEYSTAVLRARVAQQLRQAEGERAVYPNLQWLPSTSPNPREAHVPFYWMIRAQEDPVWLKYLPGSIWNCQCGIKSTADPVNTIGPQEGGAAFKPQPGLDNNPTEDGALFSQTHPYFQKSYAGAPKACKALISLRPELDYRYVPEAFPKGYRAGGELYVHNVFEWRKKTKIGWSDTEQMKLDKNITVGKILAKWGEKTAILPDFKESDLRSLFLPGAKERKDPDSWILIGKKREYFEFKQLDAYTLNSVNQNLRKAGSQADKVVLYIREPDKISPEEVMRAVKGRVNVKKNISEVWILYGDTLPEKWLRNDILSFSGF